MDRNGAEPDNIINRGANLKDLIVRPITPGEENDWNTLMAKHHYLGFHCLSGRSLKYLALLNGRVGGADRLGRCSLEMQPPGPVDQLVRGAEYERLQYITNNQRFLILPGVSIKNLASRALALNIKRLSADWETVYGHPILMVETFVDHSRFKGTCYRAAGWVPLGMTTGYGRTGGSYYYHGQTKTVLVKPLLKKAATILSAPFLPPELTGGERAMVDLNTVSIESKGGLLDYLALLKDSRKKRGVRHSQISILAVAICALLSGAKCFIAIGEWAASLNQEMLKRLGCRYNERLNKFVPPSEKTLRLTLKRVDGDEVDDIIGRWLQSQSQDRAVAVDGKTLRGSSGADGKPVHLVSAFLQHGKMVIGQRQVDKKSNEITAFKPLLEPLDLEGKVVTADAMHTQVEHARFLVEDKKADYVFPVKQNQGNLFETIKSTRNEDFSPSISNTGKGSRTN
ncbi:MAG TPA: ISAs1 family transposase [Syntrophomonas wolfei]|uniref:ISAs1 family transposase n=1 Tax=Syntrophomonas wolfei TaxID=863 RepID=A0A354YYC1_9FIRM|nr:ISAs1 family transposase [Syntrophomonas wolfei]